MKKYIFYYVPFFIFVITYLILIYYYQIEKIPVPKLIGESLERITDKINDTIAFRISKVVYNNNYEDNYIINQYPQPGMFMKNNQVISLEVNNNKNQAMHINKKNFYTSDEAIAYYKKEGVSFRQVNFQSDDLYQSLLITSYDHHNNLAYLYCNDKKNDITYIKNLVGKKCNDINSEFKVKCYTENNIEIFNCSGMLIKSQFPLPGIDSYDVKDRILHVWH
jgi:hypothetical protein